MKIILFVITSFYFTNTFAIFGHWKIKCGPIKISNEHTGGKTYDVTEPVVNPVGWAAKETICAVGNIVVKNPESRRQLRECASWGCDPVYKTAETIIDSIGLTYPGSYETEGQLVDRLKRLPDRLVDVHSLVNGSSKQDHSWSCAANCGCRLINYYPGRKTNYCEMCEGLPCVGIPFAKIGPPPKIVSNYLNTYKNQFSYMEYVNFSTVKLLTQKGFPVIVLISPNGGHSLHYIVVTSVDEYYVRYVDTDSIYCSNPDDERGASYWPYKIEDFKNKFGLYNLEDYKNMPVARNSIVYNISNGTSSVSNVVANVNSAMERFSYCDSAERESVRGFDGGTMGYASSYGGGNQSNYSYNNDDDDSSYYDSAERKAEIERKAAEWNAKQKTSYNCADSWNESSNSAGCSSNCSDDDYYGSAEREAEIERKAAAWKEQMKKAGCQYKVNPYHKCNQYCDKYSK